MDRGEPLIRFAGVKKRFGSKVVYRDLNLNVWEGESLTIIGGSGQGKSVMLKMLIGLLQTDEGTIHFDGQQVNNLDEAGYAQVRRSVQMLFQGAALFDSLTVGENVAYGLEGEPLSDAEKRDRVAEALAYVGMEGTEAVNPTSLSGGMKKRIGLARAIAIRPRVLLYDEPTTGLDPVNIGRITELILHLKHQLNVTSIVVTHDMPAAFEVSDRIAMIDGGGIIFDGTPEQLVGADDPRVHDFVRGTVREDAAPLGEMA